MQPLVNSGPSKRKYGPFDTRVLQDSSYVIEAVNYTSNERQHDDAVSRSPAFALLVGVKKTEKIDSTLLTSPLGDATLELSAEYRPIAVGP